MVKYTPPIKRITPERLKAESSARVLRALTRIQHAQDELSMACSELSALCGGVPVWRATDKLADKVRALWYRVDGFNRRGRYRLDDCNIEAILLRDQGGA